MTLPKTTFAAQAIVPTDKASRYLQALCGHFQRKVEAIYSTDNGEVEFGFGYCQMKADETSLFIAVQSDSEEDLVRVKHVVSDHLERFAIKDGLKANWTERTQ